ncbi:wall-associated receptor kinase-like 14 isoform X2 [Phragmites australis]|uniref:wall-associated receptor kinase-like 14 isoform X2 n=1 Tax=Phragmites australis TaxID=29695 RepID=UPI002D79F021|nr:wall-associated receptor kinase-like 14 isoform X2 [Phragmites australis]
MHHRVFLHLFFLLLLLHEAFSATAAAAGAGVDGCNHRCNSTVVPYPFGFSADCPIVLACNATTATPLLPRSAAPAPYPILSFNSTASTFVVTLAPSCNRSVPEAKELLSGASYGVTSRTGLFLRGRCRTPAASNCTVPGDIMTRILRTAQCGGVGNDTTWTCVASAPPAPNSTAAVRAKELLQFLDWKNVHAAGCDDALTAALYGDTQQGVPSLEFGVAELGWWLNGTCAAADGQCAQNATCHDVETPNGEQGHRCVCRDGMHGDGYVAGGGCYDELPAKQGSKKNIHIIVAGVLAGVAVAGVALLLCRMQCRRYAAGCSGSGRLAAMRLLSEAASRSGVPVYSYGEVARATNSFSHTHRLGTGAYGTVYVGKLPASSLSLVAIKRLRCSHHHEDDGDAAAALLLNEIKLISSVSHPNLVRLLGCCLDRGEQILVYEYVPNGTLSQHLLGGGRGSRLPWRARLGVAAETAASIAYLHGMQPPIFHRDVKSSNILLDGELRPKLADFGLSRSVDRLEASRSHVSTAPQGTPGYVDPEYHQNFHLSDKSDVYSFGVVLLELITAMKVVDFDRPATEVNLASLALDRIGKGRVNEIVDPALVDHGEEWVMDSVRHVSELAFRCLAFQKDVRPCMSEVAAELRRIRDAAPDSNSDPGSELEPMTGLQIDVGFDGPDTMAKKAVSPVSVQEVWVSDRSSPSTNGSTCRLA